MDVTPLGTDGEGIRLEAINWGDLGAFVQRIGETGAYEVVVLANQLLLTVQQGTWDTLAGIAGAEKVATAHRYSRRQFAALRARQGQSR